MDQPGNKENVDVVRIGSTGTPDHSADLARALAHLRYEVMALIAFFPVLWSIEEVFQPSFELTTAHLTLYAGILGFAALAFKLQSDALRRNGGG